MNSFFRSFTIKAKLTALLVLTVAALVLVQAISLNGLWHELNLNKETELKQLSQVAYSIMEEQDKKAVQGKQSLTEAKTKAKALIADLTYGNGEYFFIFDKNYNMVMHPIKPSLNGKNTERMPDANGKMFFKEMISTAVLTGESYVDYVWPRAGESKPIDKKSFSVYFQKWGWGVATGVYTDDLWETFMSEVYSVLQFTIVILILTSILVFYITKSIVTPLQFLEKRMMEVCNTKDLTLRANLDGNDELTDMATAFDVMLTQFNEIIFNMRSASEQISSASTELSVITAQTSEGMESQKLESHQVATAMTQMSTTVHEVANSISNAAQASHNAAQATQHCNSVLETSNSSIDELSKKLEQAEILIHTLETQSSDISSILSVITGIAEQTNLLALNAAIEAARAGEQGRGFAVVADEVRSLSSRTHESTNEIHNVISNLQSGSKDAVAAMNESKIAASLVVENAQKSAQALQDITDSVAQIDMMTSEIASASEQQTVVAEEINRNINNISEITDESSVGAVQTAESSEELARLAEDLKVVVEQFEVHHSAEPSMANINIAASKERLALS